MHVMTYATLDGGFREGRPGEVNWGIQLHKG